MIKKIITAVILFLSVKSLLFAEYYVILGMLDGR